MGRVSTIAGTAMLVVGTLAFAGCAANSDDGGAEPSGDTGYWTAEEVAEATGPQAVVPLFAVPKDLENLQLGFANPGLSYPFFAEWSSGMHDAAEFYGVSLDEVDLNFAYDTALSAYEQMSVKSPVIVGSGGGAFNSAVVQAATVNDTKVVVIDGALDGAIDFGVSDAEVGSLAIDALSDAVVERLASDWDGRELNIVGVSAANCPPCDARIEQSFADAADLWDIPVENQIRIEPVGTDPTTSAADVFTDYLTSHPTSATIVVSYGDATVVGAVNAAKAANRSGDVVGVASGGDASARAALRNPENAGILIGAVDYQPYSEGWNWVEAAIAVYLDEDFADFEVTRVLTADNVDDFYPDDKE